MRPSAPDPAPLDLDPVEGYPPDREAHLRDYWYVVLKRRWLVAAVVITVILITAIYTLLQTPIYRATAVLQISRGKINLVEDVMVQDVVGNSEFYPTQQRVLTSRTLSLRVVDALRLWEHPLFRGYGNEPSPEARENLAGALQSMLRVNQIRSTQLMEVSYITPDPELSSRLSNALVRQYISFASETETDLARDTTSFIGDQVEKLQREIQQKEKLLLEYSQRQDIVMVDEKQNIVMQQLEDLNRQLADAKAQRATAEARYRSLRRAAPASLDAAQSKPSVQNLKNQKAMLQKQYAELSAKFKPGWPELKRTRQALHEADRALQAELRQVARDVVSAARVEYQSALQRERLLQQTVEEQKQEAQEMNQITSDYERIKVELDNQRSMLQQLLRRQSETGLSADLGERQPVNVRIVEEALVPKFPSGPGLRRNLVMGTLLGLALAFGLAFFLDYWDTSIHTYEDLRRHVPLPYLGMVPRFQRHSFPALAAGVTLKLLPASTQKSGRRGKDLTVTRSALSVSKKAARPYRSYGSRDPEYVLSERFKFIRGSLLLSTPGQTPKTILVTGPDKNSGKTFVACNLATSLADIGKKVLLVDSDLRNPQIHRVFQFKNKAGLSNVLTGQLKLDEGAVFSTSLENVCVMLAGPPAPSPAELLGSPTMEEILATCTEHFDYVLLDSAPLLPVFDSHLLTSRCDACVLVVRANQDSRQAVKSSVELVERVGGRVTGVVLNDVDLSDYAQNYYYSYYSYEYGTYPREQGQSRVRR